MATLEQIRRLRVEGQSSGLDKVIGDLERVSGAQKEVSASGEQMATVTETSARRQLSAVAGLKRVENALDGVTRANRMFETQQKALDRALEQGAVSQQRYSELLRQAEASRVSSTASAQKQMQAQMRALTEANDNIRLTGDQVRNLGFQLNDAATMLASGSSPFQVIATQAGQVYQALGDGPGGVRGSIAAMGAQLVSFASAIGPVAIGFTAATAAIAGFAYAFREDFPDMAETLKKHEDLIGRIADRYDGLREKIEAIGRAGSSGLGVEAGTLARDLIKVQEEQAKALQQALVGAGGLFGAGAIQGADPLSIGLSQDFGPIEKQVEQYRRALAEGRDTTIEFRTELAALYKVAGEEGDTATQKAIERFFQMSSALATVAQSIRENRAAIEEVNRPRSGLEIMAEDNPGGLDALRQKLKDQAAEIKKADQAAKDYAETLSGQKSSIEDAVTGLKLQVDAFGMSAGAAAALRFETEALAEAQRAAAAAGRVVTPEQIADIKSAAGEIGTMTDRLRSLNDEKRANERLANLDADIAFRTSQLGRSEIDQRVADRLRSAGLEFGSAAAAGREEQLRYLESVRATSKELENVGDVGREAFEGIIESLLKGESAMESIGGAAAQLGRQMASSGLEKVLNGVFGGGQGSSGGAGFLSQIFGGSSGARPAATTTTFSSSGAYGYSAPSARISAADFAQASGQMMQYAGRFNSSVDGRLLKILNEASSRFDMRVEAISGLRPGDSRFHGKGLATDVQIYGADGRALGNYQDASTFRAYERFAQLSRQVQQELFPELEGMLRWGGYFSGGKGKYGALDTMHFDLGGNRVGMGGGSWESGLNATMRRLWPGADSVGMGGQEALARAVSAGYVDGTRKIATGGVPGLGSAWGPQFDGVQNMSPNVSAPAGGGFFQSPLFQGGLTALGAGMAGYQSGSPIGGALSGALAGLSTGNPLMAVVGGVSGLLGGLFGSSKQKKQEEEARKQKEAQQAQMAAQLASQIENLQSYFNRSPDDNMASELRSVDQKIRELRASIKNDGIKSEDQVNQIEREALAYKELLKSEFRDAFATVTAEFGGGLGLDTESTKARAAIQALGKDARGWVEDTEEAFRVPTELRDAILADYQKAERAASTGYNAATRTADRVRRAAGDEYLDTERQDAERAVIAARKEMDAALKSAATERDKALAEYEASVADAQRRRDAAVTAALEAGREAILRAISGNVIEQSDAEKALAQQRGAAIAASAELQRLGLSAEEAGIRIKAALAEGSARMRTDYERGVREEIEELDGRGYMGDFRALLEKREDLRKDAGLLGSDPALADELFAKRAQAIVDGADLTVEAFDKLIAAFPDLAGVVRRVSVDLEAIKGRIEGYDDRRFAALTNTSTLAGAMAEFGRRTARERDAEIRAGGEGLLPLEAAQAAEKAATIQALLVRARQNEVSVMESQISRLKSFTTGLTDMLSSLKLDANLSPLNAQERYLEAQRQFRETKTLADAGDEDAQAKLADAWRTYMEESRSFNASTSAYYADFAEAEALARGTQSIADQQLSSLRSQLDIAKKQLEALEGVDDGIEQLLEAFKAAQAAAEKAAELAKGVQPGAGGSAGGGSSFTPTNDLEHFLGVQYGAILGRAPDAAGVAYYQALRNQGVTADQLIAMIKASPEAKGRGFSRGGFTGWGGINDVAGSVHGQEYVFDAAATRAIGVPMLDEIRAARRLPLAMPYLPSPAPRSDDRATVSAIEALGERIDRIADVVFADGVETRATIDRGNRIAGKTQQALQLEAA